MANTKRGDEEEEGFHFECFWRDQKLIAHTGSEHTCTNSRGILPFSICSLPPSPGWEGRESGLGRVEEKVFPSPPSLWETGLWVAIPTFFSRSLPLTKHSTYSQRHMEEDLGCGGGGALLHLAGIAFVVCEGGRGRGEEFQKIADMQMRVCLFRKLGRPSFARSHVPTNCM